MTQIRLSQYKTLLVFAFLLGGWFFSPAQEVAPFTPRLNGGNIEIRGDIVFVGNNILNRATEGNTLEENTAEANTPYNGTANNNSLWMEYIDIDSDPSTFSSSSAELNIADPGCSQVRYAGLYWAATYPNERSTDGNASFSGTPRIEDWFNIKFQIPGGSYVDLTADTAADPAGQEDDIIYDGYNYKKISKSFKDSPYICYKNVTDLVRGNTNPNGAYTVANVRATKGKRDGSSSAGWVMVVIYENPNESGKFISTFDGYAGMSGAVGNVDVAVNGFRTLPTPFPVRARIGVGALEGDRGINNDQFRIKANSTSGGFTQLSTGQNPGNNFFNSTITTNGNQVTTRTPYGTNTLGTDLDLFNLNNPSNSVLPNGESGATLRFTSTGDGYGAFLASFAVEIIEPNIVLEKRVEDIAGNDITDGGVNLGQTLDYVLSFRNLGNDDAENYNIRDVLPTNTTFVSFDVSGAPGVAASYDASTNEVDFTVPDNRVEIGDPAYTIRLRVKVASNCFDFVDACSDQIKNLAYSTYRGEINSATITDDPSVSDFDNCGFVTPGATNFLLDDLSDCNFIRTVQLCGDNAILDAGDGFDSYVWVKDDNHNGQIDGSDTVVNDGDPDNDPSTLLVDDIGTYIVDKIIPDPCKGFHEIITVERFGSTQTNPIIDYFNVLNGDADPTNDIQGEIVTCSVDGDLLPKIFLCGTNDTQPMQINITDAQSLTWEKLDEGSCTAAPDDCANKNLGCSWSQVASGNNYIADTAGKYRLVINYTNGCFSRFYFDVFQNNLDIQYNQRDIICSRDGRIKITNLGSNYGYQLVDHANSSILIPFSAGQGPTFDFSSGENGSYRVEVVQLDGTGDPIPGACIFSTDPIGIRDRDFQVDITTTPANCNAQGSIQIDVLNVRPDYTYRLLGSDGTTLIDDETAQPDNTHTFTVNPGDYVIETRTADGCSDTQDITVGRIPDPTLSALKTMDISCSAGTIDLTRTGGQGNPDFLYAIWSKDGMDLYPNIASIPSNAYQVSPTFNFGWRDDDGDGTEEYIAGEDGTYGFVIIDANNCFAFSNEVTLLDIGIMTLSPSYTAIVCNGSTANLTIGTSGGVGPFMYSIDDGANYQTTDTFVNLAAGDYDLRVTDTSGCDVQQTYTVTEPDPLTAEAVQTQNYTCNQTGEISVGSITPTAGGSGSYQYSISGGTWTAATSGGTVFANLTDGTYTVRIRDANAISCSLSLPDIIINPLPTAPTPTNSVAYNCDGSGNISISPNDVTYTYSLDGGAAQGSNLFNNVAAGNHTITIDYGSDCTLDVPVVVQTGQSFAATITGSTNVSCNGQSDGSIIFAVSNFDTATGFEYSIDGGTSYTASTTSPATTPAALNAGAHDVIVRRVNEPSCSLTLAHTITEPAAVVADANITTPFTCTNTGATITASASNGIAPYEYRLEDTSGGVLRPYQTGTAFNNVSDGNYMVRARDDNGCEGEIDAPITVAAPAAISFTAIPTLCYSGANDATITVNVTGGNGGFLFSINGGPFETPAAATPDSYVFDNLGSGSYTIAVQDQLGCSPSTQTVAIAPEVSVTASANPLPACGASTTEITINAAGGDSNFVYALVANGATPAPSDFNASNTRTATATGDYDVYVRDKNGNTNYCEDFYDLTITQDSPFSITVSNTPVLCSGASQANLTITPSGGGAPYRFSIDDGATYQTSDTFSNLPAGSYDIRVRDVNNCEATEIHSISEPFTLSASALVAELIECNPALGAEVRIVNARGGTAPYEYSFDGGATYQAGNISNLFPGDHDVFVRDANNCTLGMQITVLPPQVPPGVTTSLEYFCDGDATITVDPDDPAYTYTYEIDNVLNTPADSNVFTDVAAGDHIVTVNYVITTVVPPSTLLTEDFGFGSDTPITEIDPVYCYEPQNGSPSSCPSFGTDTHIQDGEYTVTQALVNPYGTWIIPNDHTGNTDGRYLAINVGGVAGIGGIVYAKRNIEVLANQDISISMWAINLLRQGTSGGDPSFEIQLVDPSGTIIASTTTGNVPKNSGPNDWRNYSVDLNPGANSNLDIVIRTNSAVTNGNDIAIDDILATQPPVKCPAEVSVDVLVEAGKALEANITTASNVSCNGASDGSVTFAVENFNPLSGFEYSTDGGSTFTGPLTTPSVTLNGLSAGTTNVVVRDVADNTCSVAISSNLSEPNTLNATASVTSPDTCLGDATVQATPTGGTPTYLYQLEDTSATPVIIAAFQSSGSFSGVVAGDYVIRVRDANMCETTAPVTVDAPTALTFTASETACYSGNTDAQIAINVTAGNGTYQFNINGGPWLSPTPASATAYTFTGLDAGSYDVNVKDVYGCIGSPLTLVIEPELTVSASAAPITACATSTGVTITAAGGDTNFVYALVSDGTAPAAGDFASTNPVTVTGAGDYDVYVRDNAGAAPFCEASYDITILKDAPILITPTVTDVLCNGGSTGTIALAVTGGNAPYRYQLENTSSAILNPYQSGSSFTNLPAGNDYIVRVRDASGCDSTVAVTIAEPNPIVAEAEITKDYTCTDLGEITVGSVTATTGGSGDYQYRINGGAWSATTSGGISFPDLEDDSYVIEVRDANAINCVVTLSSTIVIDPLPTEPTLSASVTYTCDGTGDITVLPNDVSYSYSIDGGAAQAGNVFNNIAVGAHTITVDYGKGCTVAKDIIVAPGNALNASVTASTNLSCNGAADGMLTFEVRNFDTVNGFEYSIDGGTTFTGPETTSPVTISGLSAGTVNIEVRDVLNNSCTLVLSRAINQPTALVANASITAPYTCDMPGATITASATGGSPGYEYQLENTGGMIVTPYQTGITFTNLALGDYIVRGRDGNGCTDPIDTPISIVAPSNPTFTAVPTTCYSGTNDATIQVDVTSGNSNYQFNIDGGPWLTPSPSTALTYTFQNLSRGTYTINVKDQFGCIGTSQDITVNPQLTANAVLDPDLSCLVPASVTLNVAGGSGAYSYEWSDDSGATYATTNFTGNVFNTSNSGTYVFRVTDTSTPSACTVITAPVRVTPADIPVITSVTSTDILCNGNLTGALDVTIDTSIGRPQYIIEVVETNTSTNYGTQTSGLPAGDYEVRITDDKGCVSLPTNVTIAQPNAIAYDVALVPITCDSSIGTNPGSITVENLAGGTAEYTYYLTGNNGYTDTYATTASGEDHTFGILEFGIYEVDVVDANGCSVRTTNIIASPPDDLDIDVSTATVDCTTGGTAIVTVSSAVGSGNYEFSTLETYSTPYSSSYQPSDTAGGDTATFTGLTPGITYTFVVHDITTNCYYFETAATPINSPSSMTATLNVVSNVTCKGAADGKVTFTFDNYDTGATSVEYEIFNAQSNVTTGFSGTSSVNPPTGAIQIPDFATLSPGVYYILLKEVGGTYNGCSISSPDFSIKESSNLLTVAATSPKNDNCNVDAGTITAQAQHGTAPYVFQYLLDTAPAPIATSSGWTSNPYAHLESGDYIVYVKDANNCIQTDTVTVGLDPTPDISLSIVNECVSENTFEVRVSLDAAGLSPYQISLNGATFQNMVFDGSNQYTLTGLSSGLGQSIEVRDLNGCSDTETLNIQPPLQFTVQQTALLDCEPGTDAYAEITIAVTSGSGNYEYAIDGPGFVDEARTALPSNPYTWKNASAAGPYDVRIYDMGTNPPNCVKTVVIDVPDAVIPEFTETHTDVTCNGGADGIISLQEVNNGTNPIMYSLTPMPAGAVLNGTRFENLPAGTYDVRGVGTNDCFDDIFSIVLVEPNAISVPSPAVVEFGCTSGNSSQNASIAITGEIGGSGVFVRYEFINNDDPATAAVGDPIVVQDGTNTSYIETNLAGGSYTINVYDDNGCIGTTTATIAEFVAISDPAITVTHAITCVPGDDAEVVLGVTLAPVSATPNLSYAVQGTDNAYNAPNQASDIFTGLGVGKYIGRITNDDTGCVVETAFEIKDPNTFEITTDTVDVVCFGDDGSVSFTINDPINGYSGGFTWQIYNSQGTVTLADDTIIAAATGVSPNFGPTTPFAIGAGSYRVDITQDSDPNCAATDFFNIDGPSSAISGNTVKTDVTCALDDGIIEITNVLGGWGGYTYFVDIATNPAPTDATGFTASPKFGNLSGGAAGTDYQVWIADMKGCLVALPNLNLIDPTPISATLQVNAPNCSNIEGVLEVVGTSGGQGSNYTYQLQGFDGTAFANLRSSQSTPVFPGLGEGRYQVVISDQWTCSYTTSEQILYDEIKPVAMVVKAIDCDATSPGGEITVTETGGSGNFDYAVTFPDGSTPQPTNSTGVFTALTDVGIYTFTVTDQATGHTCTKSITQELAPQVEPVIQIDAFENVTCNGANEGTITVSAQDNGLSPYTFEITAATGGSLTLPYAASSSNSLSATFKGLEGTTTGITYTITATGNNTCNTTITQLITQPKTIVVDTPTVVQFGCASGNNPNNARIAITGANGGSNTFVRYEFINNDDPATATVGDPITVQDGSNSAYTETNVLGGTYTINVYDDKGCIGTQMATLDPYDELLTATTAITNVISCNPGNDGEISLSVTSTDNDISKFEYSIDNGSTYQISNVFPNLGIGNYTFLVRHVDTGCIVTASETLKDPNTFSIDIDKIGDVVCFGTASGEVTLALVDATYPGGFNWEIFNTNGTAANLADDTSVATGTEATNGPTPGINLPVGSYYVTLSQNNAPSCANTKAFTISGPSAAITGTTRKTDVTCALNDGSIEIINVLGGWGGYTYFVDMATNPAPTDASGFQNSPLFANLSGGIAGTDYQVWIADSKGCLEQLPDVNLIDPSPISADLRVNMENCTNFQGEIEVINETGGQGGNYRYQLQIFNTTTSIFENFRSIQTSDIFGGLGSGRYQVIVSDQWSCSNPATAPVELYEEIVPLATVVKTIDCTPDPGGQISISQTGGSTGTFTYTVTFPDGSTPQPSNTTGVFTDLTQVGQYTFSVSDDRSCSKIVRKSLQPQVDPVLLVDSFTDVTCFGDANGTIAVSVLNNGVGPYTFQITDMDGTAVAIAPTSFTGTTAEFTGLANTVSATGYTITATASNDCQTTIMQTITQPAAAVTVPAPNMVSFGCSTGNVTRYPTIDIVGVTGGSGVYVRYQFINDDDPSTAAAGDALIVQDGANPSYTETDLAGGNYTINVFDTKGCMGSTTTSITPFVRISDPVVTVNNSVTCITFDETITVSETLTPGSATPNLEYVVSGTNVTYNQTNATGTFTGLGVGNYTVSIINLDTGCVLNTVHSVADPDVIEVVATKLTDEQCLNDGVDDGSFEVSINNYSGDYSYQVYDINDNPVVGPGYSGAGNTGMALPSISGLAEGAYYLRITETESPFCTDNSNPISILAPDAPITATIREEPSAFSVTCSNDQGKLLVDPEGGEGPYTIVVDNTTTSDIYTQTDVQAFIFSGLSAGSFNIKVTDAYGCEFLDTIILERPEDIVATISPTALTCYNSATASVTASIDPGRNVITPNYRYRLKRYDDLSGSNLLQSSALQTGDTFNGLAAGFYSIAVTDDVSCSYETAIVEIVNPTQVEAVLIRTSPLTCATGVEFELSATGGLSGQYEYRSVGTSMWTAMAGNNVALPQSGMLTAGTYQYEVRDVVNGCAAVVSNSIEEDVIETLTLTIDTSAAIINCNGDNTAIIYADADGGLGNYRYSLFTDAFLTNNYYTTGHDQPDGEFENLPAGTYYVNVTSDDCTAPAEEVIITEPDALSLTNPKDFTNVSCNGASDGMITVQLTGGVGPYQYAISPNLNRFDDENTFDDLAPGDYRIIAQDRNGCFIELEYTIEEPRVLEISATALPEACAGEKNGSIELTINGGTAPYSTRLSSEVSFIEDRNIFNDLASGDYIVFIRDANGCEENVVVTVDPGVNLNATVEPVYGCEGNIPINYINIVLGDDSISDEVLYALDSTDPAEMQLKPFFRNIAPGSHYIAISHANGCIVTHDFEIENYEPLTISVEQSNINELTATVTGGKAAYTIYFGDDNNGSDNTYRVNRTDTYVVTVVDENGCAASANIFIEFIDIEIPNFFSPNGDVENQYWKPRNDEGFPQILTIIFDRYGREVYRMRANDRGWDGFYRQTALPSGDYWYIIKLNGENDEREFVGHFTLYR